MLAELLSSAEVPQGGMCDESYQLILWRQQGLKVLLKPLLMNDNKIEKQTYSHLIPTANDTPWIYSMPKIHKQGAPLHLIVDSIGSVTYSLAKALAEIMKPLFGWTDQHCKNSKQLAEELKSIKMKPDEKSISHDVISLFMKTSVQATIEIVQNQLQEDRTLKKRVKLAIQDVNNSSSLSPHQLTYNSGKHVRAKRRFCNGRFTVCHRVQFFFLRWYNLHLQLTFCWV